MTWVKLQISECRVLHLKPKNPPALAVNCVGMNIAGSLGMGILLPGSRSLSTIMALGSCTTWVCNTRLPSPAVHPCFPGKGQAVWDEMPSCKGWVGTGGTWSSNVSPHGHCPQLGAALTQGGQGLCALGWLQPRQGEPSGDTGTACPVQAHWNAMSPASYKLPIPTILSICLLILNLVAKSVYSSLGKYLVI